MKVSLVIKTIDFSMKSYYNIVRFHTKKEGTVNDEYAKIYTYHRGN